MEALEEDAPLVGLRHLGRDLGLGLACPQVCDGQFQEFVVGVTVGALGRLVGLDDEAAAVHEENDVAAVGRQQLEATARLLGPLARGDVTHRRDAD